MADPITVIDTSPVCTRCLITEAKAPSPLCQGRTVGHLFARTHAGVTTRRTSRGLTPAGTRLASASTPRVSTGFAQAAAAAIAVFIEAHGADPDYTTARITIAASTFEWFAEIAQEPPA